LDYNKDNVIDKINLKLTFKSNPAKIRNIKLMLFFDYALTVNYFYKLKGNVKLSMRSICYIDIDTPYGASYINTNGELELRQKSPISSGTISKAIYYDDIFSDLTSPYDYMGIYNDFQSKNITTHYNYEKLIMPFLYNKETELDLEINIPTYQKVLYFQTVLKCMKSAWIQYISILIPCAIICYLILLFIFRYQIFETYVVNDFPKN
jgi:hypothetical protein